VGKISNDRIEKDKRRQLGAWQVQNTECPGPQEMSVSKNRSVFKLENARNINKTTVLKAL
jgi:hypothetical protein